MPCSSLGLRSKQSLMQRTWRSSPGFAISGRSAGHSTKKGGKRFHLRERRIAADRPGSAQPNQVVSRSRRPGRRLDLPVCGRHIQATGRDAKGRKQYRYHPRLREVRESTKYEHVMAFAEALPAIRAKVRETWRCEAYRVRKFSRRSFIFSRPRSSASAMTIMRQNNSYGLTTLKTRHVTVDGHEVRFRFTGKAANMVVACSRPTDREDHQSLSGASWSGAPAVPGRRKEAAGRNLERRQRLPERHHRKRYNGERFPDMGRDGARRHGFE